MKLLLVLGLCAAASSYTSLRTAAVPCDWSCAEVPQLGESEVRHNVMYILQPAITLYLRPGAGIVVPLSRFRALEC